jgi:succinate dehydrogenase / fumarate reductase cytochrome b subunit
MKKRPVNLDLRTMKMPSTAIVSILHRASGFILFFFIPLFLWGLQQSLASEAKFNNIQHLFNNGFLKFVVWFFVSGLLYHLVAGIRHLLMDLGIGESHKGGRMGATLVLIISAILIVGLGVWLW